MDVMLPSHTVAEVQKPEGMVAAPSVVHMGCTEHFLLDTCILVALGNIVVQ